MRGIEISHAAVRFWWCCLGPLFAAKIRRKLIQKLGVRSNWQWHLSEVFESDVTKRQDRIAALKIVRKTMKRFGPSHFVVTDFLWSCGATMKVIGNAVRQETGRWLNNSAENSHLPIRRRKRAILSSTAFAEWRQIGAT